MCGDDLNNSCIVCHVLFHDHAINGKEFFCETRHFIFSTPAAFPVPAVSLAQSGSIYLSVHINWRCVCLCLILYLCLPFLPFHPSCHLCHLFLGYPHSHPLPGARRDRVCQAGPVTRGHCRSDAALLSAWSRAAVQRRSGRDRLLPSTPTSSNLWMQTAGFFREHLTRFKEHVFIFEDNWSEGKRYVSNNKTERGVLWCQEWESFISVHSAINLSKSDVVMGADRTKSTSVNPICDQIQHEARCEATAIWLRLKRRCSHPPQNCMWETSNRTFVSVPSLLLGFFFAKTFPSHDITSSATSVRGT